jgi:addiction module RelE/StbE family toxin
MALKVSWSEEAENNLEEITEYIINNWNDSVLEKFLYKLNKSVNHIQEFPESFPVSLVVDGIRKCVINKQISLFYSVTKSKVEIHSLFDNRQDDEKLKSKKWRQQH